MTNREWILSELTKQNDDMIAQLFCDCFNDCLECPIQIDCANGCLIMQNVDNWMQKEHEVTA